MVKMADWLGKPYVHRAFPLVFVVSILALYLFINYKLLAVFSFVLLAIFAVVLLGWREKGQLEALVTEKRYRSCYQTWIQTAVMPFMALVIFSSANPFPYRDWLVGIVFVFSIYRSDRFVYCLGQASSYDESVER